MCRGLILFLLFFTDAGYASTLEKVQQAYIQENWDQMRDLCFQVVSQNPQDQVKFKRSFDFYKSIPRDHIISLNITGKNQLRNLITRSIAGDDLTQYYLSFRFNKDKIKSILLSGHLSGNIPINSVDDDNEQLAYVSDPIDFNGPGQLFSLRVVFVNGDKADYQWLMSPPKVDHFTQSPHPKIEVSSKGKIKVTWIPFKTNSFRIGDTITIHHNIFINKQLRSMIWSTYQDGVKIDSSKNMRVLNIDPNQFKARSNDGSYFYQFSVVERSIAKHMVMNHTTHLQVPFKIKK